MIIASYLLPHQIKEIWRKMKLETTFLNCSQRNEIDMSLFQLKETKNGLSELKKYTNKIAHFALIFYSTSHISFTISGVLFFLLGGTSRVTSSNIKLCKALSPVLFFNPTDLFIFEQRCCVLFKVQCTPMYTKHSFNIWFVNKRCSKHMQFNMILSVPLLN